MKAELSKTLKSLIPISQLNQGKAAKIISSLSNDEAKIVIKNNEPIAAIVSMDKYYELLEAYEKVGKGK